MKLRADILPIITGGLVAAAGIMSLAQVLVVHIHHRQFGRIDDSLLPFTPTQNSHLLSIALGLFLIYLSLQILRRKRAAFFMVSLGLVALIFIELLSSRQSAQLVFYAVTLLALLTTHRYYTVDTNNVSLRRGTLTALGIIAVVFVYATVGFSQLGIREVGGHISTPTAAKYAAREVFTFQETQLPLHSRHARWFVVSVNGAAAVAYALAVVSLFQPLKFQYGASRRERQLAQHILDEYSNNTEDYFKLWPLDKHYFFSDSEDSFVAYKVVGRDALILADPSGNPETFPKLLRDFSAFATRSGWTVSALYASDDLDNWGVGRFQRIFIGNEAVIDADIFAATTYRSKHFRYIRNRAERDGLTFEYWQAPLSAEQLATLRAISDSWLSRGSRREYTFALGYFDDDYIRGCDIAVLTHADSGSGSVIAYANIVPPMTPEGRSIDHMRYTEAMPPTGMHYLLMQLILQVHEAGVKKFNLGLAPLSGLEDRVPSSMPERLLSVIKRLGSAYYSFGGLEQFKNKFEPDWQPRYLYYQGPATNLIRITRHLTQALTLPVAGRGRRWATILLSLAAALCYTSFPLAYFTDPDRLIHGIVSQLGSGGEAYAGLFNGLNVASGILIFIVIGLLWAHLRPGPGLARLALLFLGLAALGTIVAAAAPLPSHFSHVAQENLHDISSAVSIVGICAAAWCVTRIERRSVWLKVMLGLLLAATALFAVAHGTLVGSAAQRAQIVLSGIWTVLTPIVLSGMAVSTKTQDIQKKSGPVG